MDALGIGAILPLIIHIISSGNASFGQSMPHALSFFLRFSTKDLLVFLCSIYFIKGILSLFVTRFLYSYAFHLRALFSEILFNFYIQIPYETFLTRNQSSFIYSCSPQINALTSEYVIPFLILISEMISLMVLGGLLLWVSPLLNLGLFCFLLLVLVSFFKITKKAMKLFGDEQNKAYMGVFHLVSGVFGAFKEIKIFQSEPYFLKRFNILIQTLYVYSVKSNTFNAVPKIILEMLFAVGLVGFCTYSFVTHQSPAWIVSMLGLYAGSAFRVLPAATRSSGALSQMRQSQVYLEAIYHELQAVKISHFNLTQSTQSKLIFQDRLELKNIYFKYQKNDENTLKGLNIDIKKGEKVGIIGRSGAGKTTLMDIFLGIIGPTSGQFLVDQKPIMTQTKAWKDLVGYVPQTVNLLDTSIKENIAFGVPLEDISEDTVWKVLQLADLDDFVRSLPHQLNTQVGDKGVLLSGGQRQRISIARALYQDPDILFFDEATSSLDMETEAAISKKILDLNIHQTLVIIAHRLSTIMHCDTIFIMNKGEIEDSGTYSELATRNPWLKKMNQMLIHQGTDILDSEAFRKGL